MTQAFYPLPEAALALGITPDDVVDPVRYVRDLIRKHGISFVRHGRTVKLNQDQLKKLADRMIECPSTSNSTPTDTGTSVAPSLSGVVEELFRKPSGTNRPGRKTSQKQMLSDVRSRVRLPSKISPVENPLSRSTQRRIVT